MARKFTFFSEHFLANGANPVRGGRIFPYGCGACCRSAALLRAGRRPARMARVSVPVERSVLFASVRGLRPGGGRPAVPGGVIVRNVLPAFAFFVILHRLYKTQSHDASQSQFSYVGLQAQFFGEFHPRPRVRARRVRACRARCRGGHLRDKQLLGDRTCRQEVPQPDPQAPSSQSGGDHRRDGLLRAAEAARDRGDRRRRHRVEQ